MNLNDTINLQFCASVPGYQIININDITFKAGILISEFHFEGKERVVKEEKIDISKKDDEKWKRRSLPAGKVQGTLMNLIDFN